MDSDRQLADAIQIALLHTGHFELRSIDVWVENRHVRLDGCVATFYAKQLAQNAALSVDGVDHVNNSVMIV
jgi:osmotically-inducible protein OsmY